MTTETTRGAGGLEDDPADWPFNWEAAARLLDPKLIRQQGDFFFRRGLNIRRIIAFVGSGVSMAYGRVSWGELGETQVSGILEATSDLALDQPIQRLRLQLEGLKESVAEGKAESITLAMQLAEQVWVLAKQPLLERLVETFWLKERPLENLNESKKRDLFRTSIKSETYDERHHVRRILTNPFSSLKSFASKKNDKVDQVKVDKVEKVDEIDKIDKFARAQLTHGALSRFPEGTRKSLSSLFSVEVLDKIKSEIAGSAPKADASRPLSGLFSFSGAVIESLLADCKRSHRAALNPFNYAVLGLAIDSLRAAKLLELGEFDPFDNFEKIFCEAYTKSKRETREEFIEREKDPLWILATNLKIKRFVTTNYDLEIERLIDDMGFEKTDYPSQQHLTGDQVERIGPLGGRSRDIVLNDSNAADLLDFAAGEGPHNVQVVHVHGRATDGDDIVVTERDYHNKYLGSDFHKIILREGLQVLFGGNPILFVGMSLSEGDVMRPLREFATDQVRRNHSVIALRAARSDKDSRSRAVMEQYIQFGVYVLHYGFKSAEGRHDDCWLDRFYSYTKAITNILDAFAKGKKADGNSFKEIEDAEFELYAALDLIRPVFWTKALQDFRSDGAECRFALELKLLDQVVQLLRGNGNQLLVEVEKEREKIGEEKKLREAAEKKEKKEEEGEKGQAKKDEKKKEKGLVESTVEKFFRVVLKKAVKRIEDAVQAAALSAYLRGAEQWWKTWNAEFPRTEPDQSFGRRSTDVAESRCPAEVRSRLDDLRFSTLEQMPQAFHSVNVKKTKKVKKVEELLASTRRFRHFVDENEWVEATDNPATNNPAAVRSNVPTRKRRSPGNAPNGSDQRVRIFKILDAWFTIARKRGPPERRILVVAAPRGAGKGGLHGEFAKYGDFLLQTSASRLRSQPPRPEKRYAAQFLASFSFSSEVASVWDAFTAFLLDPKEPAFEKFKDKRWKASDGRIGRLRGALEGSADQFRKIKQQAKGSVGVEGRALVVFQAFDLSVRTGRISEKRRDSRNMRSPVLRGGVEISD